MTGPDTPLAPHPTETASPQPTVTELVRGIIDDVQKLAKQQIDMLKSEFKEDVRRTKRATELGGLSIVLMTIGGLALVACLVFVLHEHYQFSMWVSSLIIGGILTAAGVVFGVIAYTLFESFNPLPDKTFHALQENLTWKTQPQA
jgi:uncharacterized membrane protein YqjE